MDRSICTVDTSTKNVKEAQPWSFKHIQFNLYDRKNKMNKNVTAQFYLSHKIDIKQYENLLLNLSSQIFRKIHCKRLVNTDLIILLPQTLNTNQSHTGTNQKIKVIFCNS